jgi:peptidoglycan/LPS O-acetylase OafA/YrhL
MTLENIPQNPSQTPATTAKIGSINTLRFLAAIFVVIYHYTFSFYYRDVPYVDIPLLRELSQYGYLGVDLFFIISGFVISLSAEGRNAYAFFKSRVGRLYPVFWISAIITSIFLLFGGHLIYSDVSWSRFLASMTMLPELFNADPLDGTYWTLFIEMKFYLVIFILLLFKKFKDIEPLAIILSVLMLFVPIFDKEAIMWIPYFVAGIIFYKIYKKGLNYWRIFALCNTFIVALIFTFRRIPYLSEGYGVPFSPTTIALYILSFYVVFLLISLNKFKIPNNKYINILGLLTFPVYLLHHQIGRILFTYADIKNIPLYVSFTFMLAFIGLLSFAVHYIFERRGRALLDNTLDRITPSNLKHF